eukprot:4837960-Amphidinium_carterae.1
MKARCPRQIPAVPGLFSNVKEKQILVDQARPYKSCRSPPYQGGEHTLFPIVSGLRRGPPGFGPPTPQTHNMVFPVRLDEVLPVTALNSPVYAAGSACSWAGSACSGAGSA